MALLGYNQACYLSLALSWTVFLVIEVLVSVLVIEFSDCPSCEKYQIKNFELQMVATQACLNFFLQKFRKISVNIGRIVGDSENLVEAIAHASREALEHAYQDALEHACQEALVHSWQDAIVHTCGEALVHAERHFCMRAERHSCVPRGTRGCMSRGTRACMLRSSHACMPKGTWVCRDGDACVPRLRGKGRSRGGSQSINGMIKNTGIHYRRRCQRLSDTIIELINTELKRAMNEKTEHQSLAKATEL
ncbi:hypothetical protein G4B88_017785 [Cannabis sativa]|uniref:Uncharacterized protein n=1 Tax=Cannabis sativa TaxID=3483 RepID=A0A7J6DYP8_CANSA|nr:hypothetical protein G4B88_017785 [Cannabis sativa]